MSAVDDEEGTLKGSLSPPATSAAGQSPAGTHASEPLLAAVKLDADGLVPVIAQEAATGMVRMFAWANRDALAARNDAYWTGQVEIQRLGAQAWVELAQGRRAAALTLMRQAADMQDASEKWPGTPGYVGPARELLGEMLLELKQPAQALKEFETSALHDPNRFRGTYGAAVAAAQSGQMAKARAYYAKLYELAGKGDARMELQQAKTWLARN